MSSNAATETMRAKALRHQISRRSNRRIANCVFSVILGIVIVVFSCVAPDILPYVAGPISIVWGILCFASLLLTFYHIHPSLLISSIGFIGIGIITLISPDLFKTWIFYILAIYLVGRSATNFIYAFQIKAAKIDHWWLELAYGIVLLIFGILSIVLDVMNLDGTSGEIIAGVLLIVSGSLGIVPIITYRAAKQRLLGYVDGPIPTEGKH